MVDRPTTLLKSSTGSVISVRLDGEDRHATSQRRPRDCRDLHHHLRVPPRADALVAGRDLARLHGGSPPPGPDRCPGLDLRRRHGGSTTAHLPAGPLPVVGDQGGDERLGAPGRFARAVDGPCVEPRRACLGVRPGGDRGGPVEPIRGGGAGRVDPTTGRLVEAARPARRRGVASGLAGDRVEPRWPLPGGPAVAAAGLA